MIVKSFTTLITVLHKNEVHTLDINFCFFLFLCLYIHPFNFLCNGDEEVVLAAKT